MSQQKSNDESKPFAINIGPLRLSLLEKSERGESGRFLPIDISKRSDIPDGEKPATNLLNKLTGKSLEEETSSVEEALEEEKSRTPAATNVKPSTSYGNLTNPFSTSHSTDKSGASSNIENIQTLLAALAPQRKPTDGIRPHQQTQSLPRKPSDVAKGIKRTLFSPLSSSSSPNAQRAEENEMLSRPLHAPFSQEPPAAHIILEELPSSCQDLPVFSVPVNKSYSQPTLVPTQSVDESETRSGGRSSGKYLASGGVLSIPHSISQPVDISTDVPLFTTSSNNNNMNTAQTHSHSEDSQSSSSSEDATLSTSFFASSTTKPPPDTQRARKKKPPSQIPRKDSLSQDALSSQTRQSELRKDKESPYRNIVAAVAVVVLVLVMIYMHVPTFVMGIVSGVLSGLLAHHIYTVLTTCTRPPVSCYLPPLSELPPVRIPEYIAQDDPASLADSSTPYRLLTTTMKWTSFPSGDKDSSSRSTRHCRDSLITVEECGTLDKPDNLVSDSGAGCAHSTWMNLAQVHTYDPLSFHLRSTVSVHVTLHGTSLTLQRPRFRVGKRSHFADPIYPAPSDTSSDSLFYPPRICNLLHAQILILPHTLPVKRRWSKKYPIYISLNGANNPQLSAIDSTSMDDTRRLYLFTRNMREKEHWYRLLQAATLGKPLLVSVSRLLRLSVHPSNFNLTKSRIFLGSGSPPRESVVVGGSLNNYLTSQDGLNMGPGARVATLSGEAALASYLRHMSKFMPTDYLKKDSRIPPTSQVNNISCEPQYLWLNALIGRLLWDVLREPFWMEQLKSKMQAKLKKLHKPYFIDDINVVDIDFGTDLPVLRKAYPPYLDSFGLWVDLDICYSGGFTMSLETKVNPMKLRRAMEEQGGATDAKSGPEPDGGGSRGGKSRGIFNRTLRHPVAGNSNTMGEVEDEDEMPMVPELAEDDTVLEAAHSDETRLGHGVGGRAGSQPNLRLHQNQSSKVSGTVRAQPTLYRRGTAAKNSDEEDSAESSTGSDVSDLSGAEEEEIPSGSIAKGRLWRLVDKLAKSPYLAKAMDNKYVKRGMEMVSKTSLVLQVDLQQISGRVCLNLPPPPSNRLWYAFRENPTVKISAKPKLGDRTITFTRLVDWIENKMITEFQRMAVYPNMDDIVVPLLVDNNPRRGAR